MCSVPCSVFGCTHGRQWQCPVGWASQKHVAEVVGAQYGPFPWLGHRLASVLNCQALLLCVAFLLYYRASMAVKFKKSLEQSFLQERTILRLTAHVFFLSCRNRYLLSVFWLHGVEQAAFLQRDGLIPDA